MNELQVKLLGGFSVLLGGVPVTKFRSDKARALLAYLAVQPDRDHTRTTLATLLWGDLSDSAAKTNLRIELSNLNKLLANHPALEITRNTVCFHSALATVDVKLFQETINTFLALPIESQPSQLGRLTNALEAYQGEFLAGFQLGETFEFDEWQLLTQEQLHEKAMQALNLLQLRCAEEGNWAALAAAAHRQLALVPWQESAHRNLIQALAAQGQRVAALEQYAKCCAILQAELGIEPAFATQEIAARLRTNAATQSATNPALTRHNLPQQLKTLVGRKRAIAQLQELVQTERLVTVVGLGGVGKSRLAQAVAQQAIHDFADGVWFVPLANIEAGASATDRIALAIAAAIGFAITDMHSPWTELIHHLAQKKLLLVLDNWEQLVSAAEEIFAQLLGHTQAHLLATSRVRLMVEGETIFGLEGLPAQEGHALFVARALRIVATFTGDHYTADIAQICAAVGGLPLGIELAASWVEHIPVAEIGRSLTALAIAPTQTEKLADRHQTLSTVFEYSWQLLSPPQQQILARLSAFRGGFDRAAATAIANSTLSDLSMLIAHSLVQRISAGRYNLHPLVQEFAAGKVNANEAAKLFVDHSTHYLTLLNNTAASQYATALHIEFDNVRSAWLRALDVALVAESTRPFGEFMIQFGLTADGNEIFADAVARFEAIPQQHELVAQLLDQQAVFLRGLQGLRAIMPLQQRVLTLTKDPRLQTSAHIDLANHHAEQGEWAEADFHFDQAEARAQTLTDLGIYIGTVEERIHINAIHFRGDFAQGITRLEEMLRLLDSASTSIRDAETIRFRVLQSLPMLAMRHRDYGLAIYYAKEALARAEEIGHRRQECFILLDLALAEQFAGLYPQAIAHNQAALAFAEAIGDAEEMALLRANLCLTLRQHGELEAALAYGNAAIERLRTLGNLRMEGQARNRVGHTLLALECWVDAERAYHAALTVWDATQHPNRYEAVAGRAVALLQLGRQDEALLLADEVLTFVAANGLVGIVEPVLLLLHCAQVFVAGGQVEQTSSALQQAEAWVQTVAGRIQDQAIRAAFVARPDIQLLQERLAAVGMSREPQMTAGEGESR